MDRMRNTVQHYAWGSRHALARIQRRPVPSARPEAELWMGAHERAPSQVVRDGVDQDLAACIAEHPERELGRPVVAEFGPRLPFLMKLLAADEPLSLQVHPNAGQARRGDWSDPHAKPELLCAVTGFDALCGLRTVDQALAALAPLEVPELVDRLQRYGDVRPLLEWLLRLPRAAAEGLTERVRRTAASPYAELAADRPGDPGVLAALLLHPVHLDPGEALYVEPGQPHSYLHGVGVEIMGNSDNVVRGGLTEKAVDAPTFLGVLGEPTGTPAVLVGEEVIPGLDRYPAPVGEFQLHRARLDGSVRTFAHAPQLVFCLSGTVELACGDRRDTLTSGESVYVGADCGPVTLAGRATVFVATPGIDAAALSCESLGYWAGDPRWRSSTRSRPLGHEQARDAR